MLGGNANGMVYATPTDMACISQIEMRAMCGWSVKSIRKVGENEVYITFILPSQRWSRVRYAGPLPIDKIRGFVKENIPDNQKETVRVAYPLPGDSGAIVKWKDIQTVSPLYTVRISTMPMPLAQQGPVVQFQEEIIV